MAFQIDVLEQVVEHIGIVVLCCVEQALALLFRAADPVNDKAVHILVGHFLAMLEQQLQTLQLIGITGKDESAKVAIFAHTANNATSSEWRHDIIFLCDQLGASI